MVINSGEKITWQTFPDAHRIGCWLTTPYSTTPYALSPDGCSVVTAGNRPGEYDFGLFVLSHCGATP